MKPWLFVAGFAVLGLMAGCRDDGLSDPFYEPVAVSPTPTPDPNFSPTPTPIPGVTPTPSPTPSAIGSQGAAMTSDSEQVTVADFLVNSGDGSETIYVQRANGETWSLNVAQSPALTLAEALTFQSTDLIFGSTDGALLFPDGTQEFVIGSSRIR